MQAFLVSLPDVQAFLANERKRYWAFCGFSGVALWASDGWHYRSVPAVFPLPSATLAGKRGRFFHDRYKLDFQTVTGRQCARALVVRA